MLATCIGRTHPCMSTGMYWSVIRDDFYLWLSIVSWCHFEWSCENNAQSAVMENKGNLRLLISCPSSWTAYRIQRTEVWFFWAKKKSCSLCFKNVNISHLYNTCNLFLSSSSIVSSSFVCMAACGCSRGRCRLRMVCACVCSRTHHRWRNCQESVIRSGRVTLGRRRNMKYYKPLFCLITSESLALKCSSCGLWHVLWEAHSCGTSLNFIS